MSFSRAAAVIGLCLASAGATQTSEASVAKGEVIACLAEMESETTWNQCRGMMFAPCADHAVGGEGHLACLTEEQTGWRAVLDERTTQLNDRLTTTGTAELSACLAGQSTSPYCALKD
ncbi:MAG TPA: hypothetical protein VLA45_18580 [Paracoccaceae bacterium]|nr:hypothetical protein [Paracoccaceae bacterium]